MPLVPNPPLTNSPLLPPTGPLATGRGFAAPPLVASSFTARLAAGKDIGSVIRNLFPAVQEAVLNYGLMQTSLDKVVPEGLAKAAQLGQRGVVIHQEMLVSPTFTGLAYSFRSPETGGVSIVGVGPDANSVCASVKCHNFMRPPLPSAATKPTIGSGYYFYEQGADGSLQVSFYPQSLMEQRSLQLEQNVAARESYLEAARARAMDDYVQAMQAQAHTAEMKAEIISLAARRNESTVQRGVIERNLALELERARRFQMMSSTLQGLAQVLTLASAIAMVTATMGAPPPPPEGQLTFENMQQLVDAMNAMSTASSANAIELQRQLNELRTRLKDINTKLLDFGTGQGMDAPRDPGSLLLR